jgi:phosphatidylserine synthase
MTSPALPSKPPRNLFGVKDLFTTLNVLGGAVAILLCIEGYPFWAGVCIVLGWIADIFDGMVARALGTANRFGGEYDTIADHLAHIIAPAAIVFTVYKDVDLGLPPKLTWVVAAAMASAIMISGSVRHARNVVRPVTYKGIWCGLPRTAVGFLAIGYANSVLIPHAIGGYWIGVVVCALSCCGTLTHLPYTSHHLARKMRTFARLMITLCLVSTFGMLVVMPVFVFDVLFFWMAGYSAAAWMGLTPEERRNWKRLVEEAKERGEVPG